VNVFSQTGGYAFGDPKVCAIIDEPIKSVIPSLNISDVLPSPFL